MQHRLHGLRGNEYRVEKRRLRKLLNQNIKLEFDKIYQVEGTFTPRDLGRLANLLLLPLTVLDEFLPQATDYKYKTGTWDRLKDKGLKAKDIGVMWE
jgi:hypothetical protein